MLRQSPVTERVLSSFGVTRRQNGKSVAGRLSRFTLGDGAVPLGANSTPAPWFPPPSVAPLFTPANHDNIEHSWTPTATFLAALLALAGLISTGRRGWRGGWGRFR